MLTVVGGLYIKQRIEVLELVTSFETENKYDVFLTGADCVRGSNQQPYFFARESSDCFQRCCFLPELHIYDGADNLIGSVHNRFACCSDEFTIYNHEDMPVMSIHGDCCQWGKFCTCPCGPCKE